MPFDPAKPEDDSLVSAEEMRAQLIALKALIDSIPAGPQGPPGEVTTADLNTAIGGTAQNPTSVATLSLSVSDPPTQADVIMIVDKLNEFINATKRT